MTLEKSLFARLSANATLTSFVGDMIYPGEPPTNEPTIPCLVYTVTSAEPNPSDSMVRYTVEFEIVDTDTSRISDINKALSVSLNKKQFGNVHRCFAGEYALELNEDYFSGRQAYTIFFNEDAIVAESDATASIVLTSDNRIKFCGTLTDCNGDPLGLGGNIDGEDISPASITTGSIAAGAVNVDTDLTVNNSITAGSINAGNANLGDGALQVTTDPDSGAATVSMDASGITSGTLYTARLPTTVARTDLGNAFVGNQFITGSSFSTVPLSVRAAASNQTGNLFVAYGSDNVSRFAVTPAGGVSAKGAGSFVGLTSTGPTTLSVTSAASVPLKVKSAPSQTGDLQQWQDSTGAVKTAITSSGSLYFEAGAGVYPTIRTSAYGIEFETIGNGYGTMLRIDPGNNENEVRVGPLAAATSSALTIHDSRPLGSQDTRLVVRAGTSQTKDLTEWQSSSGNVLASIGSGGNIYTAGTLSVLTPTSDGGQSRTCTLGGVPNGTQGVYTSFTSTSFGRQATVHADDTYCGLRTVGGSSSHFFGTTTPTSSWRTLAIANTDASGTIAFQTAGSTRATIGAGGLTLSETNGGITFWSGTTLARNGTSGKVVMSTANLSTAGFQVANGHAAQLDLCGSSGRLAGSTRASRPDHAAHGRPPCSCPPRPGRWPSPSSRSSPPRRTTGS